jgi:predicted NACHT family NTPase
MDFIFENYLTSICTKYEEWWEYYTITDVQGEKQKKAKTPCLFDFGLRVQEIVKEEFKNPENKEQEKQEKIEKFAVLEGLRKYATDHVLLIGKPGSGKSTALIRLLLEEAEKINQFQHTTVGAQGLHPNSNPQKLPQQIPILVELRFYQTSIVDLIQKFLHRHDPELDLDENSLKNYLRQGQFLLLIDGINELPSEAARQALKIFRDQYQKTTPMIFTTRDLGVGGDLNLEKKLEMLALTETQMQQFVRAYLPKAGESMLKQLKDRL